MAKKCCCDETSCGVSATNIRTDHPTAHPEHGAETHTHAAAINHTGQKAPHRHTHDGDHDHAHDDDHDHSHGEGWRAYLPVVVSTLLLGLGLLLEHSVQAAWLSGGWRLAWYLAAYLPVAWSVWQQAATNIGKGQWFTEFTLMALATLGAFGIGEYPEAVAVMLFYTVGELFQEHAVQRAKQNIQSLLDLRPAQAQVWRAQQWHSVAPQTVQVGERILVKAGERLPLDGLLHSQTAEVDTAALTGESVPRRVAQGEPMLAGMINLSQVVEVEVNKPFADSALSRILDMVQSAAARKAPTELMIRKLARIYTPVVFVLALAVWLLPYLWLGEAYSGRDWLYRALVFLVIACPCALVVSIPLGYFGGIGAASRHGILFKGGNYLDALTEVDTLVMDKTGTVTEGVFAVQASHSFRLPEQEWLPYLVAVEQHSNHPIARAINTRFGNPSGALNAESVVEIAGQGLRAQVNGRTVLVGNSKLLQSEQIAYEAQYEDAAASMVWVAIDGELAGLITVADRIKTDAASAIRQLHRLGVRHTVMLSGDKTAVVTQTAQHIGLDQAYGDLLPQDKVTHMSTIKQQAHGKVAYVGDGINDAPVLALSDVGLAMGGMGSDAAIETADVVIQTDELSKIATAIRISRATQKVVWQNIALAFGVKVIVLILGAGGLATLWEAVFADVGVALLAIVNAVRIQRMRFDTPTE